MHFITYETMALVYNVFAIVVFGFGYATNNIKLMLLAIFVANIVRFTVVIK